MSLLFRSFPFCSIAPLPRGFKFNWLGAKIRFLLPCESCKHDWGSLSGAKDDTHKSQHRSVPVYRRHFWFGKQARDCQDGVSGPSVATDFILAMLKNIGFYVVLGSGRGPGAEKIAS